MLGGGRVKTQSRIRSRFKIRILVTNKVMVREISIWSRVSDGHSLAGSGALVT